MNKEILQQFKEGKFSPLEIEVACATAFANYPRQEAEWYQKLFAAQSKPIALYISTDEHNDWPEKAEECLKRPVVDVKPPTMELSASARALDIAVLHYANWLTSVTRAEDLVIIGYGVPRAILTRLVPLLEKEERKCDELVIRNSKEFICFRSL